MENCKDEFGFEEDFFTYTNLKSLFTVIDDNLICLNRVDLEFEGLRFNYLFTIKKSEDCSIDVFKDNDGNGLVIKYKPIKIPLDDYFFFVAYEILNIEVYYCSEGMEVINMKDAIKNYGVDFNRFKQNMIDILRLEIEMRKASESYRI